MEHLATNKPILFTFMATTLLLLLTIPSAYPQVVRTLAGRVVDISTGKPLAGATVRISGWIDYRRNVYNLKLTTNDEGYYSTTLGRGYYTLAVISDDPDTPGIDYVPAILQLDLTEREQSIREKNITINFELYPGASVIIEGSVEFVEIGGAPTSIYLVAIPVQRQRIPEPSLSQYTPDISSLLGLNPRHIVVPSDTLLTIQARGSQTSSYIVEDNNGFFYKFCQGSLTTINIDKATMNRNVNVVRDRLTSTWLTINNLVNNGVDVKSEIEDLNTAFDYLELARRALREESYSQCFINLRAAYIMNNDVAERARIISSDATFSPIPLSFLLVLGGFGLASIFIEKNILRICAGVFCSLIFLVFYFFVSPGWGLTDPLALLYSCILAAAIATGLATLFPNIGKDVVTPTGVALMSSLTSTFSLATRNLKRRRLRSFMVFLSILVLVFAFTAFTSFQIKSVVGSGRPTQPYPGTEPPIGLMVTPALDSSTPLPTSLVDVLKTDPTVFSVAPKIETSPVDLAVDLEARLISKSGESLGISGVIGISSDEAKMTQLDASIIEGRYLMEEENASMRAILISARAANMLHVKSGDSLTLVWRTSMNVFTSENFTIAGIFDDRIFEQIFDLDGSPIRPYTILEGSKLYFSSESIIILNWKELMRINLCDGRGNHLGKLTRINVQVKNNTDLVPFAIQFAKKWRFFIYVSDGKEVKVFYYTQNPQLSGGTAIPMLLVLVGLNVLACTLNAVYERRKEIVTFSLVGINPSQISYMFLAEAGLIAFIGSVVGYLVGLGGPRTLLSFGGPGFLTEKVSWTWSVAVILLSVAISVSASALPALKASTIATPKLPLKWKLECIPAAKDIWLLHVPQLISQLEIKRFFKFIRGKFEEMQDLRIIPEKIEFKEIVDESNHEKEVKKLLFTYSFAQEGSRAFMTENELILTRSRTSSVYSIDLAIKTAMLYNYGPLEVVKKTAATVRQIMLQWTATPYYERWGETAELVKIEDLSVISDGKYVLKGINMEVKRGEIMGLIGEGSRALILTIAGLYKPTSGSVTIGGIDSYSRREEVKTRIGILLKGTKLYEEFTPRQNLIYLAKLEGKDPKNVVNDILERSALQLYADTKMMDLSPETKRKVMISQLLIRKVSLLLLEDPLDGLKDHEAEGVKSLLMNLSRFEGITIICSGKNYQELDFSDRVAILKKGSIEMMVNKKGESIG